MYSKLIKKARVFDGDSFITKPLDIAIQEDEIVAMHPDISEKARQIIDARNLILTPGFIDIQNHSDSYWSIFDYPRMESLITQGFTTILIGQCGGSLAPLLSKHSLLSVRKWHSLDGANINWTTYSEFLHELNKSQLGCNVATLVGYSTLRRGLVGDETRSLTDIELNTLKHELSQALKAGAFGMSSGLAYSHEVIISELELYELLQILSEHSALFSVHLRNESEEIIDSLEEILALAKKSQVNIKISHLKIRGHQNQHLLPVVLDKIETAFHQGVQIHFDVYPYNSIWQVAYSYLPKWAAMGGRSALLKRLQDPMVEKKLLSELSENSLNLKKLVVASTESHLGMVGKTLAQISKNTGLSVEETYLTLVKHAGVETLVFDECISEETVKILLKHPQSLIATDGAGFSEHPKHVGIQEKLVHPRCFGTAPKAIRLLSDLDKNGLNKALTKLTSAPAEKLGLENRGRIKVGYKADLVLLNLEAMLDKATLSNPFQYSTGIDSVWVNGESALSNGELNQGFFGKVIKKSL